MHDWKQAYWLAKFELKASKWSFLYLFLFSLLMLAFFSVALSDSGIEKKTAGFDLFFILTFSSLFMIWLKPKDFQMNRISGDIVASPSLIMLAHLAVKKDVIIKSRLIVHFVYSIPFQLFLLLFLYPLAPALQSALDIHAYIAFSILWLSFGFYAGFIFFAGEAGEKSKLNTTTMAILTIFGMIAVMFLFTLLSLATGHSIFTWTIILAQNWPLASSLLSIVLAISGVIYWLHYARKTMDNTDYL